MITHREPETGTPRPALHVKSSWRDLLDAVVFLLAVFVLVEMAIPRFLVDGPSMEPTFYTSQRLLVSRMSYLFGDIAPGDILVFNAPLSRSGDAPLVKRAIGMPGDRIEFREQQLYINNQPVPEPYINEPCEPLRCPDSLWMLGDDEYFVMGDNRNHSRDSRAFGPVTRDRIIGEAIIRYWPPDRLWIIPPLP